MLSQDPIPITITQFRGVSLMGAIMGFVSWGMAPLVHKCNPHFYLFDTWAELCRSQPGWFHVGIFGDESLDSQYQRFVQSASEHSFNFLLIDHCCRTLAWRVGQRGEVQRHSLHPFEGGSVPKVTNAIREFLQDQFGEALEIVSPLYIHDKHQDRVNLIIPDFEVINEQLLDFFGKNPHVLYHLHHRKFEEFLARLFRDLGYDVELGPGSGDGGVDLRLLNKSDLGEFLVLVQAKKYAPHRPIDLQPVQALFGAVEQEKASHGLLVTTSFFQPAAKRFASAVPYRLQLAGPAEIQQWLAKSTKRRG